MSLLWQKLAMEPGTVAAEVAYQLAFLIRTSSAA